MEEGTLMETIQPPKKGKKPAKPPMEGVVREAVDQAYRAHIEDIMMACLSSVLPKIK